jgi:sulfate transport system substrate-binding protein
VVDVVARRNGTGKVAAAYLEYLYTESAQEIIAKHHYRPTLESVKAKYASKFPTLDLVSIEKDFGGWKEAQTKHFAEGGIFDQIYAPGR